MRRPMARRPVVDVDSDNAALYSRFTAMALQETFSEQSKSSLSDRWVSFRDIDDGISDGANDLMLSFLGKISKQSWVS